jgi:CHAT domain-containing protein/Tfp pilus assembly protein PilF
MKLRIACALMMAILGLAITGTAAEPAEPAEPEDPQSQVAALEALGESYQYAGKLARAEESFRSALKVGESVWGESLQVAGTLARLGNVVRLQSRLDEAQSILDRALDIRQRLAPDSLAVADSLHQRSLVLSDRGESEKMSEDIQRALKILERWPPDCLERANILSDQALFFSARGLYSDAAVTLESALRILEQRAPGSIPLATSLGRLGLVYRLLGDPVSAVEALQRALEIRERLAPDSLGTAAALVNLGLIAQDRGDLDKAEECFRRALDISGRAVPNGIGVAGNLNTLGTIARLRGDLDQAWNLHRRALEIGERLPNHFDIASTLNNLGIDAEARGDLDLSMDFHQRALALLEEWSPRAVEKAQTLLWLGRLQRRKGHLDPAAQLLAQAVDALESQVGRIGGSYETQANYRAGHKEIYRDAIEIELARGHSAAAFQLVERSRARGFLALLAERDLKFHDLPTELDAALRDNAARYDRAQRDLARRGPEAGPEEIAEREALLRELASLRHERDEIADRIRKASPRLAALSQPQPLDAEGARKVLDPGTLALSYSVGKEQTALFALTREGGLQVKILPLGEERLRREVESFLAQVRQPGAGSAAEVSRSLYRELVEPVAGLVKQSERLLILPDGPLHRLPFGALRSDPDRFLIEQKPLHTALSLTVYGTIRASGPPKGAGAAKLVAFGDPRFPKAPEGRRDLAPGLRSFNWAPLPNTRREVERIAEVYPGASVYLGDQATEERAKSVGRDVRVLHFATHGYTDDRSPLDSALVLTMPAELRAGQENGLLQVWEIFESVRLDADLVVLSSCESALGRELSGEGLIGLTRAFQYAGARSVVASLWSVADRVTAELMARFYRHYAAGLSKDEALRAAQMELIRGPVRLTTSKGQDMKMDASAPFYWAAFELFGDRR